MTSVIREYKRENVYGQKLCNGIYLDVYEETKRPCSSLRDTLFRIT